MPDERIDPDQPLLDATEVAERLAAELEKQGCDYAVGGALALGCWSQPRGTIDVDVTLFISVDDHAGCLALLKQIGATYDRARALQTLADYGYCRVQYAGRILDVFLPLVDFYQTARDRIVELPWGERTLRVWDAETLCIFKLMFFRDKDFADLGAILRAQGDQLDRTWIEQQAIEIFGQRDPRVSRWRELVAANPA